MATEQQIAQMLLQIQAMGEQQTALNTRLAEQQTAMQQLQQQLQTAVDRAERAQETTANLAKVSAAAVTQKGGWDGGNLVDGRAVGQPFKYTGKADQDFAEWVAKFTDFVKAKWEKK